jgi:hypothetical protein
MLLEESEKMSSARYGRHNLWCATAPLTTTIRNVRVVS